MAVSSKTKIPVGTVLAGKYRITREIGRGGMATVHEAENIDIGKRIAIKVLAQELTGSSIVVERFLREARAAAAIRSPYICDVYDSGKLPSGQPFLVLELLEGESLYERMTRQRQLDVPTTVQVITQVCRGLTKAHAASIVHRDLKPENIFLTKDEDGLLLSKILDFGLAKFYTPTTKDQTRLTREGAVFGTPAYMSPEQVRGQGAVDHRADLWALGCITYECFTGKTVWSTDQGVAMTFAQIASAPLPRPARYRPDLPVTFTEWFDRTLDRDINKRYQTAKELAEALSSACGVDRRESSEIRSSPIAARDEAAAALGAPSSGPAPMSPPRAPPPAPPPPPPQASDLHAQFQPLDDGTDGDGDPTRVLTKRPLVKQLETGPRKSDDPRMERFRRGPDGKIAKVVPQVAPNAPPVPAALAPPPGSHRTPTAPGHGLGQQYAQQQAPASQRPASQRPPPPQAPAPHVGRPRHAALDQDSEIAKNPFAKARRRQRLIVVITLLVIAVVVTLAVVLTSAPPERSGVVVDTAPALGATGTTTATGSAVITATGAPTPPPAPRPGALPAWLADVREAQTSLATGDVKTASAKLAQATSKSNQHGAAQGLAKQIATAIWVRGACTLSGIARPRTYDITEAGAKRAPSTRPSVVASGSGALVAWTDAHTGTSRAYVARVDGGFAISEAAIDLTPEGGDVQRVELAAWGDKIVAMYTDAKGSAPGTYARWIGADGKPAGQAVQIGPAKSAQGAPSIFVLPGRAIYAAWGDDGDRDSEDLFLQKLSQTTLSPDGAFVRMTDLTGAGATRARAVTPRGALAKEALHLVFELERKPASFIEHQTVAIGDVGRELTAAGANREGKVAGTLALVNIDKGRAHAPQIACSQDLCFVAWHGESPPGAQGAAFDAASGKPVWRRTFSPNADFPVVATGSSGAVLAAWLENGKVVAAPLGRAGYAKTAKVGRAQGPQGGHTTAALSLAGGAERGQFYAAWLDLEASVPEPYVARLACP